MKSWAKFKHFHSRKCIWKCCLENGGHFVSASMCLRAFCAIQQAQISTYFVRYCFSVSYVHNKAKWMCAWGVSNYWKSSLLATHDTVLVTLLGFYLFQCYYLISNVYRLKLEFRSGTRWFHLVVSDASPGCSPDLNLTPLAAFFHFCRAQRRARRKRKKAARGVRFKSGLLRVGKLHQCLPGATFTNMD